MAEDYLGELLFLAIQAKPELWAQLLLDDDAGKAVLDFISRPETQRCFVGAAPDGQLRSYAFPPESHPNKVLYLLKLHKVVLSASNVADEVVCGDMAGSSTTRDRSTTAAAALEHLHRVATEVTLPLLANPEAQAAWPEPVGKELLESLSKLVAATYVTIGQVHGKTLLPLPPTLELGAQPDKAARDKERLHALEQAVHGWTRQIKGVLKLEQEAALKTEHPGPLADIAFWRRKATNLTSIQAQLQSDKIKKAARVLDLSKSAYYAPFHRVSKEVCLYVYVYIYIYIYVYMYRHVSMYMYICRRLQVESLGRTRYIETPDPNLYCSSGRRLHRG